MLLDKTLLLKGVAGIAAVGGVVGGGYFLREELGIVSSSKKANGGVQEQTPNVDNMGIPTKCTSDSSTSCSLTLEDLKKIKFKDLDNGVAETIEPANPGTLTLTITSSGDTKKYTFNNTGAQITLKKGSDKTVTLNTGATEFTEEGSALKKVEGAPQALAQTSDVDVLGIPNKCNSAPTNCQLTVEDLKKIKFQVLDGNVAETVEPSPTSNQITLTITNTDGNNKKYTFNNSSGSAITLKKGNDKTVTLKANTTTEFTVEGNALKIVEAPAPTTDEKGIPTRCTPGSSGCQLTTEDLKKIKFKEFGESEGTVTIDPSPTTNQITLTIDSSTTPNKYKFNNSGSQIILKKSSGGSEKTVTLKANGETEFTVEGNALKEAEVAKPKTEDEIGIPTKCTAAGATNPCTLTPDELKKIKFQAYGDSTGGTVTLNPESPTPQITLSISASGSTPKIYTFKNTSTSAVTLTKAPDKKVTLEVGETEFTVESNKLKSYEDSTFKGVNDKLGNLKLPNKCKFKSTDKNNNNSKECSITLEELKKVEFENKQDNQDLNITGITTGETIKLGIKKLVKNSDQNQYGSNVFNDNDPLITFKDTTSRITIKGKAGSTDIIIPKKSNTEFLMNATGSTTNKLSKYRKGLIGLPPSWGILCTAVSGSTTKWNCTPYSDNDNFPKFFESDLNSFKELKGVQNSKNIFEASGDKDDYNLGFEFKVKENITGTNGSPTLTANDTYEIKWSTTQKKWGYVKKNGGR